MRYSDNATLPLVTVAIPTYNNPNGLSRTLTCITRQTYKNIEILVSDNCTIGRNGILVQNVLQFFMADDSRITFFKQSKNILGNNFIFLLEKARGDYFMWAADDDYWEDNFIELLMRSLLSDASFSSAFTFFYSIDLLGHRFRSFQLENFGKKTFSKTFRLCLEHEFMGKANAIYALHKKEPLMRALDHNPMSPWHAFADVNVVMDLYFMGGISVVQKFCFYKSHALFYPYSQQVDTKSNCRVPVVTCKNNRKYVQKLLLSAFRNKCLFPVVLALLLRLFSELYYRLLAFGKITVR